MKQPEALRLADEFNNGEWISATGQWREEAAAELRRLHEANQEMLEALGLIVASDDWPQIERIARAAIVKGEKS